ncbi:protein kinase domain [Candidatus Vecturithrix granuli]|uniref:non-specific serine/threonine protein kinase n=1 Tax=Vecturithrix granuli TaxID=1499967 RepID=A0A081C9X6_VECG1|nr:protein kinase domain [Candidatus Vecturithrix granuli]
MNNSHLLNQRYEIKETLGHGGFTTTYRAFDRESQRECAIKCLSFRKIEDWKTLELFEREAKVLRNLDHPQIPRYLDFFTYETEHDTEFYLVQEYVQGKSLAQLIQEGRHFTEREVLKIASGIARVLEYLHSFSPPLIHRDIKPGNILVSDFKRAFLIDFGSVRDTMLDDIYSSRGMPTIVGTFEYMPIEQAEGRAVPASDIYSLGMTLITVLSHQSPASMDRQNLRIDFRPHVNISPGFAAILDRMVEPDWHHRYQHASELRRDLEGLLGGLRTATAASSKPSFSMKWTAALLSFVLFLALGIGSYRFLSVSKSPVQSEMPVTQLSTPKPSMTPPIPMVSKTPAQPEMPVTQPSTPKPIVTQSMPTVIAQPARPLFSPTPEATPTPQATSTPLPVATPTPYSAPLPKVVRPSTDKIRLDLYRDFSYVPEGWPMGLSVGQTSAGGLSALPYERLLREPNYRSRQVLYGYLPLGNGPDQQISFVLDELDRPNWIAYVDRNNNEDLTDDGGPYHNEGTGIFAVSSSVMIEILTSSGKLTQPYDLWMWVVADQQSARFYARCHYAAKLFIDNRLYDMIAFEQFEHNGLYRESGIWIDLNQDQHLDETREHFSDGDVVSIGSRAFQLELLYP